MDELLCKAYEEAGCDAWFCGQAAQAAFVAVAEGFSPAAAGWRTPLAAGLKPSAGSTKPCGLAMRRAKPCITP